MASLNGVEIKNLKMFYGHEGEPLNQGTVYLNGRKLGFWSEDSHGGCNIFDFDTRLLDKPFYQYKSVFKNYEIYNYIDIDSFMFSLLALSLLEDTLKKSYKKERIYSYYWIFELQSGEFTVYDIKTDRLNMFYKLGDNSIKEAIEKDFKTLIYHYKESLSLKHLLFYNPKKPIFLKGVFGEGIGEYASMKINVKVGTEEDGLKEKVKYDKEISQRILEESDITNDDKYVKYTKSERFKYENIDNMVKITDTYSNKEIMIPLYCLNEVKKVLMYFLGK